LASTKRSKKKKKKTENEDSLLTTKPVVRKSARSGVRTLREKNGAEGDTTQRPKTKKKTEKGRNGEPLKGVYYNDGK